MLPGEDLAGLFQPPAQVEPFRQGVVLTFDPSAGTSTVDVGGVILSNLPLLNIGDTVNLRPNNVVVLMRIAGSWAILGRVVTPGAGAVNASAVETQSLTAYEDTFGVSTADQTRAALSFTVPAWANKATVMATGTVVARNSTAVASFLYNRVRILGVNSNEMFTDAPAGARVALTVSSASTLTGLTPGQSIDVAMRPSTQTTAWASDANNRAITTAIAVFTKV